MTVKKPLLCIDIDGTLFRWQLVLCWLHELAKQYATIGEIIKDTDPLFRGYKDREVSFEVFVQAYVERFWESKRYVGISAEDARQAAKAAVQIHGRRVYTFTRELLRAAKSLDWLTLAISGSPQEAVEELLLPYEVDAVIAVRHPVDGEGRYTDGDVDHPVHNKAAALQAFLDERPGQVDLTQSVAIGDSPADASMLQRVDWPICFNPNKDLTRIANQHGWPSVLEVRNVHHFLMRGGAAPLGMVTPNLQEILPPTLAEALQNRLAALDL